MDSQTKIIFALIGLIAILAGVFVLKTTGVIKKKERTDYNEEITENIVNDVEEQEIKTEKNNSFSNNDKIKIDNTNYNKIKAKTQLSFITSSIVSSIIAIVIAFVICIGVAKLYRKIGMPEWCVFVQCIMPIISLLESIPILGTLLSIVMIILLIIMISYFFECVGMTKLWALLPIIAIILAFLTVYALLLLIPFMIVWLVANVKIVEKLGKGAIFTVGIILLPVIFMPILGYMRD